MPGCGEAAAVADTVVRHILDGQRRQSRRIPLTHGSWPLACNVDDARHLPPPPTTELRRHLPQQFADLRLHRIHDRSLRRADARRWPSEAGARRTVFRPTPDVRAIARIGIPSDRYNLRISAQSSTLNTPLQQPDGHGRVQIHLPLPDRTGASPSLFESFGYGKFAHGSEKVTIDDLDRAEEGAAENPDTCRARLSDDPAPAQLCAWAASCSAQPPIPAHWPRQHTEGCDTAP